jgi:DNA-binding transcriptional ArsR family regulator
MSNYRKDELDAMAAAFKALSNPNRLKIFIQLLSCCPPGTACSVDETQKFCISELGQSLDVANSTLSHHIKELNRAGLIQMQRRGQHIDCWVDPESVETLRSFFDPQKSC